MKSSAQLKILIIIPAYNEEKSISTLIHEIQTHCSQADILVVNDHSHDQTESSAVAAGAQVVTLPFNLGIGGAVQTGYKIAAELDYDIAVQVDGDGQHDPRFLPQLLAPLIEGKLDFSIGSRFLIQDDSFKSTFLRRVGIRFFCRLLKLMTGLYLTDPTSGFRACGKNLIQQYAQYYPIDFPEPEAIKIARRYGARIGEVAVQMRERQGGQTSIRYLSTLYYMIKVTMAILIDALKQKPEEVRHAA
ncbi:MAG TPA: glycosyltransferase family 2 protein [Candidatus Omnitrophota bacterium]|nr:glycosyltransferase family 2 protein [Candidatus Omnitrophota bacterium]